MVDDFVPKTSQLTLRTNIVDADLLPNIKY